MPTLLVISGLDPTGGAGLLADARVAAEHGVRVVGVTTATTVQDTRGVTRVRVLPAEVVGKQLSMLLDDVPIDAVKIGMLGSDRVGRAVARALLRVRAPIVWDPVFLPSRGNIELLTGDADAVVRDLLPQVRLCTPNLDEAARLAGIHIESLAEMRKSARALRRAGAQAVLVKGGHLVGPRALDLLHDGEKVSVLECARIKTRPTHGTGCVLSSAIASHLALGQPLLYACQEAKTYVEGKLRKLLVVGQGAACLV